MPARRLPIATAKEQLHRHIDGLTETQALEALRVLERRQAQDPGDRLDALFEAAPPDDEPLTAEEEAALAEARAEVARGETFPLEQVRRELLG